MSLDRTPPEAFPHGEKPAPPARRPGHRWGEGVASVVEEVRQERRVKPGVEDAPAAQPVREPAAD